MQKENITSCQIEIENLRVMVTPAETVQPDDTDHDMEGATYIAKVSCMQLTWLELCNFTQSVDQGA